MDTMIMLAPSRADLVGTLEAVPGYAPIVWTSRTEFEPSGGTEVDWNGQRTVEYGGRSVFLDDDQFRWLAEHLISWDMEALPVALRTLMQDEVAAYAAIEHATQLLRTIGDQHPAYMFISAGAAVIQAKAEALRVQVKNAREALQGRADA